MVFIYFFCLLLCNCFCSRITIGIEIAENCIVCCEWIVGRVYHVLLAFFPIFIVVGMEAHLKRFFSFISNRKKISFWFRQCFGFAHIFLFFVVSNSFFSRPVHSLCFYLTFNLCYVLLTLCTQFYLVAIIGRIHHSQCQQKNVFHRLFNVQFVVGFFDRFV